MMFIILAVMLCEIMSWQNLNAGSLYGSLSYGQGEFLWYIRLEMLVVAFLWCGVFMVLVPDRKILGRVDTFPVYVMHGFIVLYIKKYNPFLYSQPVNLLIASLISTAVILLFGNKYVGRVIKFFFRGEWVIKIWDSRA